jgi:hypothetical protein
MRGQQRCFAMQVGKAQCRIGLTQAVAVSALECRAGQHIAAVLLADAADFIAQCCQPVGTVGIAEGDAGAHAGNIGRRMEGIAFDERHCSACASCWPTDDLPLPLTPMTTQLRATGWLMRSRAPSA